MLFPHSQTYFKLDEGDDLTLLPKMQIQLITFDRASGQVAIDLESQPTLRFQDTEENLLAVTRHRDFAGPFKTI